MGGLDLAAVLRVLDQNWNELAAANSLPREARNWVKELQSARNRWAHAPVGGVEPRDAFRDADTLERLLAVVDADAELMDKLSLFKAKTLTRLALGNDQSASPIRNVCWRRLNLDPPCRLNFDPGLVAGTA